MKDVRVTVDQHDLCSFPDVPIDSHRADATADSDIQKQMDQDNEEAMAEVGTYICGVRARVGITQRRCSNHMPISVDTLGNWEQDGRYPTGPRRVLLRIIDPVAVSAL